MPHPSNAITFFLFFFFCREEERGLDREPDGGFLLQFDSLIDTAGTKQREEERESPAAICSM